MAKQSLLPVFASVTYALGLYPRNPHLDQCQIAFPLFFLLVVLQFYSFISSLIFKSSVYFELVFVYGVKMGVHFVMAVQFSLNCLLKELSSLTVYSWHLCQKSVDYISMGLFLGWASHVPSGKESTGHRRY